MSDVISKGLIIDKTDVEIHTDFALCATLKVTVSVVITTFTIL